MSEQCGDAVKISGSDAHLPEVLTENNVNSTPKLLSDDGSASELRGSLSSSFEGNLRKQLLAENDHIAVENTVYGSKDAFARKVLDSTLDPKDHGSPSPVASIHSSPGAFVPQQLTPNSPFAFNARAHENVSGSAPPSTSAFIFGSHSEGTSFTFGSPAVGPPFTYANGNGLGGFSSSVGPATTFIFGASPAKTVPPASSAVSGAKAAVHGFGCLSSSKDFVFAAPPLVGFHTDFSGTTRELPPVSVPVTVPTVTSAAAPDYAMSTKLVPVITSTFVLPDAPLPDITLAATVTLPAMENISLTDQQVVYTISSETIPIRKADIPTYLNNSEFYRSLQDCEDEDETILVPSDCVKNDETVINNDGLRSLLLTLRFWVADRSRFDAILEYVLREPFVSYEKIVSAFYEDFPILKHFKALTMTTEPIRAAIDSGDLQLVQYFLNRGDTWPNDAVDRILQVGNVEMLQCALQAGCEMCRYTSCTAAAGQGYLSCLRVVHKHGARWDQRTTAAAARGGHLECLQYAHENGCPWCDEMRTGDEEDEEKKEKEEGERSSDEESLNDGDAEVNYQKNEGRTRNTCLMAAAHAQLDCLKYAHSQGVGIPRSALRAAAKHPRGLECLQYGHQQGLRLTSGLCASAVSQKNLPMLKYLLENGCPCNQSAFIAAARAKNYEFLTFLKENVSEFGSSLCQYAAGRNDVNTVLYLLRNGCPPSDNIWSLTGDKFDQVFLCFQELALPWSATPEASSYVAMTGNTEHMKRLIEAGCPWHPETTMQCARKNVPAMIQFVHENGCPWHSLTCENAAQAGAIDCLKYAYTHGAVIQPELSKRLLCVLPGDSAGLTRECVHCVKLNTDKDCIPPADPVPTPMLAQTSAPKRRILKVMKKTTV